MCRHSTLTPASQGDDGTRAFGPALDALLSYLGATPSGFGPSPVSPFEAPRFPSVRVMTFLSGAPNLGLGALDRKRWLEAQNAVFPPRLSQTTDTVYTAALVQAAAAADALGEPQTEFYVEASSRAAVRTRLSGSAV